MQTSAGWGWVLEAARTSGFGVAEAEHWRACSLLPISACREKKRKEQHSCHGNGSGIKEPADLGLRPQSSLLEGEQGQGSGNRSFPKASQSTPEQEHEPAATRALPSLYFFLISMEHA